MSRYYETVLFDLDGTLLDSVDLILRSYHHSAQVQMRRSFPDQVWLDRLGQPLRIQFQAVTEDTDLIDAMVASYVEYYHQHHDQSVAIYPSVLEVVASLSRRGTNLAIVTSKQRPGTSRALEQFGLSQYFPVLVTAQDVKNAKPHPEPVEKAMALVGASPDSTVFIGDSPHDIDAGSAAGVATAAALWGPFEKAVLSSHGPSHMLDDPKHILDIGP